MSGSSKDFCSPENISVVIPYRDFEKLCGFAKNYEQLEKRLAKQEKQLDALRGMYREALDKIAEIKVYL